jgi:arylsulfatase
MDDQIWEFPGGERPWWQRKALEALYDGCIRYIDAEVDRLVSALSARGELDETLVVVTSDHGEGFGEPSRLRPDTRIAGHDAGVHECLLHVPLVVRYPGGSEGEVVDDVATLTAFPDAVAAALDGDPTGREFVPDGPAYASSHGLEKPMEERALGHVDDVWRFNGDMLAVYEDAPEGARKYAAWREEYGVELTVPTAGEAYVSGSAGRDRATEAFAGLEPRAVTEETDGEVSRPVRERLEDLGYA